MTQIFIRFTYKYTRLCKGLGFIRFLMFLKEVSSAHQGRIYWIKNAVNCEILLQFKIKVFYCNIFLNTIYSWDQSWIFSIITPVSHDPSEIILICWFDAHETCIIINVEKGCASFPFYFFQDSLINKKFKRTAFIWNKIYFEIWKPQTFTLYNALQLKPYNKLNSFLQNHNQADLIKKNTKTRQNIFLGGG